MDDDTDTEKDDAKRQVNVVLQYTIVVETLVMDVVCVTCWVAHIFNIKPSQT